MKIFYSLQDFYHSQSFLSSRTSRAIPIFIIALVVILVIGLCWITFFEIDDYIKAKAFLRPVGTISLVRSLISGQVLLKNYVHNQIVIAGDLLWEIDVRSDDIELKNTHKYLQQIDQDMIENQILFETINNNRNMALNVQTDAWVRAQAYLSETERLKLHALQASVLLVRERTLPDSLRSSQKIADLENELKLAQLAIESWGNKQYIQCQVEGKNLRQSRQNLERRLADIEEIIKKATMIAPISGRIDEIKRLNVGDYLLASDEILRIIPQESRALKAELRVAPIDIARVQQGQTVNLRFPGLPPSDFGQLAAIIKIVPADISLSSSDTPVFLVEAEIPEASLTTRKGEKIQLRSGMGAEARVTIAHSTILQMILHKIDFIDRNGM
jgi:multidrug resistance efflux pump